MKNLIDKSELISKLQTLEGLTNDERSSLIGLLREHKRSAVRTLGSAKKYGLVWEDKPEDVEERLRESLPVLREVKDKAIIAGVVQSDLKSDGSEYKDFQSDKRITNADTHGERIANPLERVPNHILIEGDNLEALTALSYTHEGRIDVIYIDPPYNTGNKDFVYNDSFVDSEDSYRHSKWLSFMNKRLKIAKKLLSDKGVIFISIDDNEQAQLKLLCDEVFGQAAYVSTLLIESSVIAGPRRVPAMQGSIVKTAEYCLVYTRNEDTKIMRKLKYDFISGFDTHYNKWVDKRSEKIISLTDLLQNTKDIADIFRTYKIPISIQNVGAVMTIDKRVKEWLYSEEIASCLYRQGDKENIDDTNIPINHIFKINNKWYVKADSGTYNVFRYIDRIGECDDYFHSFGERTVRGNLWKGFSSDGGNLDKEGGVSFKSGKKPIRLVKQLLDSVCNTKDGIVLDFFAGSGTTMHATMLLNEEDGGHRRAILVTNNENGICENITYVRNRNIICGYGKTEGLKQNSLRYYKTDYISRERTQKNMRNLVAAATDLLCIKEDLYEEQRTFGRLKLKPQLVRYFNDGRKHMLIIYREELIDEIVEEIKNLPLTPSEGRGNLKIYVFSPGRYPFTDNFSEVADKVELVALPAAIYDAYQKVLPKRREKLFESGIANPLQQRDTGEQEMKVPADLFEGQGV